ncbi:MAG: hypothetical protein Q9187_009759, partial [Circinaria calcarea]
FLLASQRSEESWKAIGNVLLLRKADEYTRIQYVRMNGDSAAYHRILVDETQQNYLSFKATGEIRQYDPMTSIYEKVGSHANPPAQVEVSQPSRIWANFSFLPFGDSSDLEPRLPSGAISLPVPLVDQTEFEDGAEQSSPSGYLHPTANRKIENWARTIAATMDPNEMTPEPPKQEKRRRRKVRQDSDDDEPGSNALPAPMSAASEAGDSKSSFDGRSIPAADHEK